MPFHPALHPNADDSPKCNRETRSLFTDFRLAIVVSVRELIVGTYPPSNDPTLPA